MAPDFVQVENLKDAPFVGRYDSKEFVVPAKGKTIIDREAALIWFGNWDARNVGRDEAHQYRTEELKRLQGIYGATHDDPRDDPRIPEPLSMAQKWEANQPKVRLFDEKGERIVTVLEDPEGSDLPLEGAATSDLGNVIEAMKKQMADLESRLSAAQEVKDTIDIPDDDPANAPRRRRGPVAVDAVRGD